MAAIDLRTVVSPPPGGPSRPVCPRLARPSRRTAAPAALALAARTRPPYVPARRTSLKTAFLRSRRGARRTIGDGARKKTKRRTCRHVGITDCGRRAGRRRSTYDRVNERGTNTKKFRSKRFTPRRFVWTKVTRRRASTGDRTFFRFSTAVARADLVRENG